MDQKKQNEFFTPQEMRGESRESNGVAAKNKKPKTKKLAVDLDGMIAQWQKWTGNNKIGLPVNHNIVQMKRWKEQNPDGKVIVTLRTIDPTDVKINAQTLSDAISEIREWLEKNDVQFDELWTKPYPPATDEIWTYKGDRDA